MPPRTPQRRPIARTKGSDPTVSIASAATARNALNTQGNENQTAQAPKENPNDDLKKLIESLKNKLGNNSTATTQKTAPPAPQAKGTWNRSIAGKETTEKTWTAKPAYTILTRVSNHEKVPTTKKAPELTINSLPHSFLYKPGADGIQIGKLNIKAGKQVGMG